MKCHLSRTTKRKPSRSVVGGGGAPRGAAGQRGCQTRPSTHLPLLALLRAASSPPRRRPLPAASSQPWIGRRSGGQSRPVPAAPAPPGRPYLFRPWLESFFLPVSGSEERHAAVRRPALAAQSAARRHQAGPGLPGGRKRASSTSAPRCLRALRPGPRFSFLVGSSFRPMAPGTLRPHRARRHTCQQHHHPAPAHAPGRGSAPAPTHWLLPPLLLVEWLGDRNVRLPGQPRGGAAG